MRRIVLLITICCQVFWVAAQKKAPKWMDKQRKAVVTVTTYGKDNQKKASGTGFFITETGEALSGYSLFKDSPVRPRWCPSATPEPGRWEPPLTPLRMRRF